MSECIKVEPSQIKKVLEAALLAAREPMTPNDMKKMFDEEFSSETLRKLLDQLREEWVERPVELIQLASGWRFRTRAEYLPYIESALIPSGRQNTRVPSLKPWPSSLIVSR